MGNCTQKRASFTYWFAFCVLILFCVIISPISLEKSVDRSSHYLKHFIKAKNNGTSTFFVWNLQWTNVKNYSSSPITLHIFPLPKKIIAAKFILGLR